MNELAIKEKHHHHLADAPARHAMRPKHEGDERPSGSYVHPPAIMSLLAKNRPTNAPRPADDPKPAQVDEDSLSNEDDEVKVYGDEGAVEEEKRCSKTLVEDKIELVKTQETQPSSFSVNSIMGSGLGALGNPYLAAGQSLFAPGRSPFYPADLAHQFASWWPTVAAAALYGAHHNPFAAFSFPPMFSFPHSVASPHPTIPGPNFHAPHLAKPLTPYSNNQTPSPSTSVSSSSRPKPRPMPMPPTQQHQQHHQAPAPIIQSVRKDKPHIKKPLNAFMLFMKEQRPLVLAESEIKESAAINAILGQKWHNLTNEEKSKYFALATEERKKHLSEHPDWSARDNYGIRKKGKKRERVPVPVDSDLPRKCRARFGVEQSHLWCKPCRRKKRCIQFSEGDSSSQNGTENEAADFDDSCDDEEDEDDLGPPEAKMSSRPISNMPLVYMNAPDVNINRER